MKKVLIASFDMEIGGVERSLISMLNNFDYDRYQVDLMLYSHTGDLLHLLPEKVNLLAESKAYKTFRMPIKETLKSGNVRLSLSRILAKYKAERTRATEPGYRQMQYMWKGALPVLPSVGGQYEVAISYLWPHYTVAEKVDAKVKVAWIHTDFSTAETDVKTDLEMWGNFHYIAAVSEECKKAFLKKYPALTEKVIVIENITSPDFVQQLSTEKNDSPMQTDNRFKVITVARLSHAKGVDNAVRALKVLKQRGYQDIVWYVVGYGGDEDMLRELIAANNLDDSFFILGKKTNPYPYIKAADLYVQPSRYEGKAVTVKEAQILGKPVLITNYPTAGSQVSNGVDGIICDLSIDGIADGIETLYNDRQLISKLAANCANQDYNNAEELDKLYQRIEGGTVYAAE